MVTAVAGAQEMPYYPDPHPASQPCILIPIPQALASPNPHQFALGDSQFSQHGIHDAVSHSGCDRQLDFTGNRERGVRATPLAKPHLGDGCSAMAPGESPRTCPGLWLTGCVLPEQEWEEALARMEDAKCTPPLMVRAPLCLPQGCAFRNIPAWDSPAP